MPNKRNSGIFIAEMGPPPDNPDMGSLGMGMKRPKNMAGTKVPVSPAAKSMAAARTDESIRHYKGVANSTKQK